MQNTNYYKVGISGHRNLNTNQKKENIQIIKGHLLKLQKEHPEKEIALVSPLADGADRVAVLAAIELGMNYEAILPLPIDLYMQDFNKESKKEFKELLSNAKSQRTIGLYGANTIKLISNYSIYRDFQYRQVGREVVNSVDEMIIISDDIKNNKMGGTQDIRIYADNHKKKSYIIPCNRS